MIPVRQWSSREIRALREARRMSLREFATHLGVSDRSVAKWTGPTARVLPRPVNQAALDTSLCMAAEHERELIAVLLGGDRP